MKKYFYLAAVSAMMLTACSSEKDVLETTTGPAKQEVTQQAVGFDVYTPAATAGTRAGMEGTLTTSRMQQSEALRGGFGVYSYLTADADDAIGDDHAGKYNPASPGKPNFMVNEKLLWNPTNQGWYYNPLKYWPNETDQDSQDTPAQMEGQPTSTKYHLDRLSFFAYAPYVSAGAPAEVGITSITAATDETEPTIGYKAALTDPNASVDLLWGVAPAGGLTYTAVNGRTVNVAEGMPLIDMTKPDINTTMKFLFNHALARIGVKAVAAVDQVGAGGKLDPNTKITIESITLTGLFGSTGNLNLDNTVPNKANWITINGKNLSDNPTIAQLEAVDVANRTLTLNTTNSTIAEHLRWVDDGSGDPDPQTNRVGVTTVKQDVIEPSKATTNTAVWTTKKTYAANELAYSETTPYYSAAACTTPATVTLPESWRISSTGVITTQATNASFAYPMTVDTYAKGTWYKVTDDDVTAKTYDSYQAYTKNETPLYYTPKAGKPVAGDWVVKDGFLFIEMTDDNKASYAGEQSYTLATSTYTPTAVGTAPATGTYVIGGTMQKPVVYYAAGEYYKRDANYFMVVPTQNFENSSNITTEPDLKKLRTIRVKIEYYITTEDSKLAAGRAQTKNVIEKDVVFPSLANGKSYNLNLILGLTSVKMEAEVDDWKVVNVQGDLPQNTAD